MSFVYTHTDESGILTAEYRLRVSYTLTPGRPATHIDPAEPPEIDVTIQPADVSICGNCAVLYENKEATDAFAELFRSDATFNEAIIDACVEHERDSKAAARESHDEARLQARRDNDE